MPHANSIDRRDFARRDVAFNAEISVDGATRSCEIVDISVGGAKVQMNKTPAKGTAVSLHIADLETFEAVVTWSGAKSIGLKFLADPDVVAESLLGLAVYA